jgi:hypothetical protein
MRYVTVLNRTTSTVVGLKIEVADTSLTRLIGLLGRSGINPDCGLLIRPSSGVHTFGMRFPIDVVALDRALRVRAFWNNLRPWRTSDVSWKTHAILELPSGRLQACNLTIGDQLEIITPAPS